MKTRPSKVRKRSVNSSVSNSKYNDNDRAKKAAEMYSMQHLVDLWNTEYVGKKGVDGKDLVEHFKNIQLDNGYMVIHMYRENPVKSLVLDDEGNPISINCGVVQIDARRANTDVPHWIDTPFPVIDKGVIMAISPQLTLWYYELKEKLAKYDPIAADNIVIPTVGDIVYTNHFMFKETRYYADKQDKTNDFVRNQLEHRLDAFDFLFKVTNFEIESIVKRDRYDNLLDKHVPLQDRTVTINPEDRLKQTDTEQHPDETSSNSDDEATDNINH